MNRINRDTGVAIFLLLFCGIFFAATFDIRETSYGTPGAGVWPRIILLALTLLSAGYLAQSLKRGAVARDDGAPGLKGWLGTYRNALWCYFLFAMFLVTMPYLGMLLGGVLFVFGTLTALGRRDGRGLIVHAAIALGTIGFMWGVFTYGLHVMLPQGELFYGW
jgi:hypothetical protein